MRRYELERDLSKQRAPRAIPYEEPQYGMYLLWPTSNDPSWLYDRELIPAALQLKYPVTGVHEEIAAIERVVAAYESARKFGVPVTVPFEAKKLLFNLIMLRSDIDDGQVMINALTFQPTRIDIHTEEVELNPQRPYYFFGCSIPPEAPVLLAQQRLTACAQAALERLEESPYTDSQAILDHYNEWIPAALMQFVQEVRSNPLGISRIQVSKL